MMMQSIAQEVAPSRIRVNSIAPGVIERQSTRRLGRQNKLTKAS